MIKKSLVNVICLLVLTFVFNACKSKTAKQEEHLVSSDLELLIDDNFEYETFPLGKIEILSHELKVDKLSLQINVSQACGKMHFKLISTSALMKSLPPQKQLYLVCTSCENQSNKTKQFELLFQLNALKTVDYETIVLNIENYNKQIIYHNKPKIKQ